MTETGEGNGYLAAALDLGWKVGARRAAGGWPGQIGLYLYLSLVEKNFKFRIDSRLDFF